MSAVEAEPDDIKAAVAREFMERICAPHAREPRAETPGAPATVELVDATSLKPERIRWLWPGWVAKGKIHLIAGAPGTGKTTITLALAASVSSGGAFPDGFRPSPGRVLIWSGEDDPADTLVPRLQAAGADLRRIQFVGPVSSDGRKRPFDPAQDVPLLIEQAERLHDLSLFIVDPLVNAVAGDSHKNGEVRRALAPLVEAAQRLDAAVIGVTHYAKSSNGRDPLERVIGSIAFGALARIVLGTARQEQEDDAAPRRFMLARAKSNIGPDGGGFAYGIQTAVLDESGITTTRIDWQGAVKGAARELLAEPEADSEAGRDAADFLRELLVGGPLGAPAVFKKAREAGFSESIMQRAKRRIGAASVKNGMAGGWVWKLPEDATEGAEDVNLRKVTPSPSSVTPSAVVGPADAIVEGEL